jgi:methanogenic corrinoid protein MtbC1
MLELNPICVFDDQQVAVHIPIGQFQQIEEILKETGHRVEMVAAVGPTAEDKAWLGADLAPDLADDATYHLTDRPIG